MLRIRMVGLALVAVFAMGAVVASSASAALPEFINSKGEAPKFTCSETAGGRGEFSTKAECENPLGKETAKGKWHRFGTNTFTSTSGVSILKTANGEEVICKKDTNEGELTGAKTDIVTIKFTECSTKVGIFTFPCEGGAVIGGKEHGKEEIWLGPTNSTLGYINKAKKEVGDDLSPKGEVFVEFNCVGGIAKVMTKGSVIGKITPVNTMATKFSLSLKFSAGNPCKQEFTKFEGGAEDTLSSSKNGGAFEGSCESSEDMLTLAESGEIKA